MTRALQPAQEAQQRCVEGLRLLEVRQMSA
jgi:hypothetical protein